MQTLALKNVADIRTGYTFRKAASPEGPATLKGLQISDIRETKIIDPANLASIKWEGRGEPPVLKAGDVVLVAKSSQNRAAIFLDQESKVLPSNQFLILTVKANALVSPEFLCWLLNYQETQKKLADLQVGTKIFSISKSAVQDLEIPVPSRETQNKLLQLDQIFDEEVRLTHALLKNREDMVRGISKKLLYGELK